MDNHLLPIFSPLPVCFERGRGVWLTDTEGKEYLDGFAGIAVNCLGHGHPKLVAAMQDQCAKLVHCSNYFRIDLQEEVAARLCRLSGMKGAFFCNSGLEANEAAVKLLRKWGHMKGYDVPRIVVFEHAFHGRSVATLSATGNYGVRKNFYPMLPDFVRIPAGDIAALERVVQTVPGVSGVLFECVQGEGGISVIPDETVRAIRRICDEHDLLMVCDEVQCGMGRTGKWFGWQWSGVKPDAMTLAKALGGGMPVGALVCGEKAYNVFEPGDHGTTFGGNPLAMRAARTVIDVLEEEKLVDHALELGTWLQEEFRKALAGNPLFDCVRGRGLMIGVALKKPCGACLQIGLRRGVLFSVTAGSVIRIVPALTMTREEGAELVRRVRAVVDEFAAQ